ncbi:MAG: thiol:disulfide interchange protein DsbA/DsbL [Gammaproteobacteria bacterium]|nr:thiol:disulfide interchange protein DsbA/DsbL [Gammaproteobacteria bacterium]
MNQHFDNNNTEGTDKFEKSLSAIALVAPSEIYGKIPDKLQAKNSTQGWAHWKWITAGVLACSVIALAITITDALYIDSSMVNQSENIAMSNGEPRLPSDLPALSGDIATNQRYVAEEHFIELANPIDMSDSTTTEVVAFFWYPCWPCSEFEEYLASWESELDGDVILTRMPAIWSSVMRFHARAYFTAQVLGILDQSHQEFYVEFEKDNPAVTNEEELQQYFAGIGISAAAFFRAYNSETTMELLDYAEAENRAYQIQSTPSMFVAGKYGVSPQGAGGFQGMLDVTDFLIEGLKD